MRLKLVALSFLAVALLSYCSNENNTIGDSSTWVAPEAGRSINLGDTVNLEVKLSEKADSVVYYADGKVLLKAEGDKKVSIDTDSLPLGINSITAKIYRKGVDPEEINTNIVLKSTLVPQRYSFTIEQEFKHDTSSYTQGLEFHDGIFYESDGLSGESSIRKVEPATGKVLQMTKIASKFAEGITLVGDKILMLTYQDNINMEFDAETLRLLREFPSPYAREGWGLCNDGTRIYNTDGSNVIHFLNKETYMEEGSIEVYDNNGPVDSLNELEWIDGKIYANIYLSNRIVIINPLNGQITGEADLTNLYPNRPSGMDDANNFVLNGIAWDKVGKRLFVTGKKWDKLFQIKLHPEKAL